MTKLTIHEKIGLADLFSERVKTLLDRAQFNAVLDRNGHDGPGSSVCHTHDFCDANMLMAAAWQEFFGSPVPLGDDWTDEDAEVWNDAWAIAKAAKFFIA